MDVNDVLVGDDVALLTRCSASHEKMSGSAVLHATDSVTYWLVLDALAECGDTGEFVRRVSEHLRSVGGRVRVTDSEMLLRLIEYKVPSASMKAAQAAVRKTPELVLLPSGSRSDGTGCAVLPEKGWYGELSVYLDADYPPKAPPPCIVLWGGPGRGKSMVLEYLRDLSGTKEVKYRTVIYFSGGALEFEDWDNALESLREAVYRHDAERVVLLIDDYDALAQEDRQHEKSDLLEFVMQCKCRRVLVTNNYFSLQNRVFRDENEAAKARKEKERFHPIEAKGVHQDSLAQELVDKFGLMATDACMVAQSTNGDYRAAVNAAKLGVLADHDAQTFGALHYSLLDSARAADPLAESVRRFGARDDTDRLSELVLANAPRMVHERVQSDPGDMELLSKIAATVSDTALYETAIFGQGGDIAADLASEIAFETGVQLPLWLMRNDVVHKQKYKRDPVKMVMEFPSSKVHRMAEPNRLGYLRVLQRIESVARIEFKKVAEQRAVQHKCKLAPATWVDQDANVGIICDQYCAILFGAYHGYPSALLQMLKTPQTEPDLKAIVARCAENGLESDDFVFLCKHELCDVGLGRIPADSTIERHFTRSATTVARVAETPQEWQKCKKRNLKVAASPQAKKKAFDVVQRPHAQRKIDAMLKKQTRPLSLVGSQ